MSIRVLIVDDHSVVRQGLRMFLGRCPEIEVVGEASDGSEAVQMARDLKPDVAVMDILMPVMDGLQATAAIRRELPGTEVVTLTSVLDDNTVVGAIKAGAIGYMLKSATAEELCNAVRDAASGQVRISPDVVARLVREVYAPGKPQQLTEREEEVLRLIGQGKSNKQIARELDLGENTARTHVHNVLRKLNLPSRTQAALYAVRTGMVTIEPQS